MALKTWGKSRADLPSQFYTNTKSLQKTYFALLLSDANQSFLPTSLNSPPWSKLSNLSVLDWTLPVRPKNLKACNGSYRSFEHFLWPGSREFDLKSSRGWGIWLCLGGVENLNRKCEFQNIFFLAGAYQTHVVVSDHAAIGRKDIAFVSILLFCWYRFCE